jgi:transcriptional regulator with XRE-family HTH domain
MQLKSIRQLGEEVRRKRIATGLSRDELALVSGVSRSFIQDVECGTTACALEKALLVLAALGMAFELGGTVPGEEAKARKRIGRPRREQA